MHVLDTKADGLGKFIEEMRNEETHLFNKLPEEIGEIQSCVTRAMTRRKNTKIKNSPRAVSHFSIDMFILNGKNFHRSKRGPKRPQKKLALKKKMKRRQDQSLQKLYQKVRKSAHASISISDNTVKENQGNASCIIINESTDKTKMDIHDLTDGRNIFFVEDRIGDEGVQSTDKKRSSCRIGENESKIIFKKNGSRELAERKSDTITLSDEEESVSQDPLPLFSPLQKAFTTLKPGSSASTIHSSTPISSKTKKMNISNLSAVTKTSPTNKNLSTAKDMNKPSVSRELKKMNNLTLEINSDEFVTIDLTHGTRSKTFIDLTKSRNNSVIELEEGECSISNVSSIIEPEVTVVNAKEWRKKKDNLKEKDIAAGIDQMNSSEKGRLLALITDKIFNGCDGPTSIRKRRYKNVDSSAEDSYIRDMFKGSIRESIGNNLYNPDRSTTKRSGLRMIVIDGSNVAMTHGKRRFFSVKGLKICIDYFLKRGHTVKAFVPQFRCCNGRSSDPLLLSYLERQGLVVYTPSRKVNGRCFTSYDDRFIIQCAAEFDGVIVSLDCYRDLLEEHEGWRQTIENRLLQYTWVQDAIIFPQDPLGKNGPRLDQFLRHPDTTVLQL